MFRGPHFNIISTMQERTTPVFKVFGGEGGGGVLHNRRGGGASEVLPLRIQKGFEVV